MTAPPSSAPPPSFLAGGGHAAERILARDWSGHPMGPPDRWPDAFVSALTLVLNSPESMILCWGADLHFFFNDTYAPLLGPRADWAMGARFDMVWADALDQARPIIDDAMAGRPRRFTDLPWRLATDRGEADTWWTFSYSRILDRDGAPAGLFIFTNETTAAVKTEAARAEAARSLAAERVQIDQMFEQAPTFMALLRGSDHVIERANPGYLDLIGERDVIGMPIATALPESVEQGFVAILDQVYRRGEPYVARDTRYVPVVGGEERPARFCDFVFQPLRDPGGEVTGIFIEGADVTDRMLGAQALARKEEQYTTLLNAIDVGFCIIEMRFAADGRAEDYRIVEANPAFERLTGMVDKVGQWVTGFAPDLERHWFDTYGEVARTGRPIRFENEAKAFGRWYDVTALPIGAPADARVAVLFNDVTTAKRLEAELRHENEGLEEEVEDRTRERDRLWSLSRDPFLVADARGTWLAASPAWTDLLGWREDELVGRRATWMEHPDDRATSRAHVEALALHGGTRRFENRFRTRAGAWRWFAWTAVAADGLLFCTARDVTAEKEQAHHLAEAEEQLRQAQKVEAMGQLTGGVAHDFNNLLTVIRGSAELLRRPDLSDARRARYVAAIADTADRASRLTSQLLAFARRSPLSPEVFDVGGSITALQEVIASLSGGGVEVELRLPDRPYYAHADRSQFDTAVVNMAVNARDAMAGGGRLVIGIGEADAIPARPGHPRQAGSFVTVALTDTGTGIAPDRVAQIFEPFYSTKGLGHGTGLGLSQVFGFAKQSGGEVTVDSVEGAGATFTLYLPRAAAPAQVDDDPQQPAIGRTDQAARVLVVEDNAEVGEFAVAALEELGYAPVLARHGVEALAMLDRGIAMDLVFSDVMMPGLSGIELAQAVRARHPALPILLTSGYSDVLAAEGTHGFDLIRKPYTLADLAAALGRSLNQPG